jgi:hypothetical protein
MSPPIKTETGSPDVSTGAQNRSRALGVVRIVAIAARTNIRPITPARIAMRLELFLGGSGAGTATAGLGGIRNSGI